MVLVMNNTYFFKNKLKDKSLQINERKLSLNEKYPDIFEVNKSINMLALDAMDGDITSEEFKNKAEKLEKKLEELLVQKGYDKDYLTLKYDCEYCKDIGYVNGTSCIYCNVNQKESPKETFDNFDESLFDENIGEYKRSPREQIMLIKNKAFEFINKIFKGDADSLLFCGTSGTGKTFLAKAIGSETSKGGKSVKFLTSYEFERALKDFKNEDYQNKLNEIMESELLILDDLGVESQTEYINNGLLMLINYRIEYNLPMIITTNLTINEIRSKYNVRIFSRIAGSFVMYSFYGKDLRVEKRLRNKKR